MASWRRAENEAVLRRSAELVTDAMDLLDAHAIALEAATHLAVAQQKLREALTLAAAAENPAP